MPWPLPETVTASTPNHPGDSALVNRFLNTFDHDAAPAVGDSLVWDGTRWVPDVAGTGTYATSEEVDALALGGTYEGTWDSGTAYSAGAIVAHEGATFAADSATTAGEEPGVSSKWAIDSRGSWIAEVAHLYADSGSGTSASPWTHSDGTGGINAALSAAQASGKPVYIRAGYYTVSSAIDNFFDGAVVTTDGPDTVLVVDSGISSGLAISVVGTSGDYLERVHVGGMHLSRTGAGTVRVQYTRDATFGRFTADGPGGGVLSVRDIERCQFDGVLGKNLGASGAALFALRIDDCQFGPLLAEGGQEAVDLFETHRCQFQSIVSLSAGGEGLDIGCSSYNQFDEVLVYSPTTNGVSLKVEDGGTSGGTFRNHFTNVTVIGQTGKGFDIANAPATPTGSDVNDHNTVDTLTVYSTVAGATGVRLASGSTNPAMVGNRFTNVNITVPDVGVLFSDQVDAVIDGGWVESTGAVAVQLTGTTDASLTIRPTVANLKLTSGAGSNAGAINVLRAVRGKIVGNEVISSDGHGIYLTRVKHMRIDGNTVRECNQHGIYLQGRDEADWNGLLHCSIRHNVVENIGKAASFRYGVNVTQAGATTCEAVYVDGNDVYDTQGTSTSRGFHYSGTFDWVSWRNNTARNVIETTQGTVGVNGVDADNLLSTS